MAELKGTIKILENKIILKTEGKSETYIKRYSINDSSWIEFKGDIYELELDSEVESEDSEVESEDSEDDSEDSEDDSED